MALGEFPYGEAPYGESSASNPTGTLAATLPLAEAAFAGSYIPPTQTGTLAVTLPLTEAAFTGTYSGTFVGSFEALLPPTVAAFSGTYAPPPESGTLAVTLPLISAAFVGSYGHVGTLNVVLPLLDATFYGTYAGEISTDTSNAFNGRSRGGGAIVVTTVPVAEPPPDALLPVRVDKAIAFPLPTIVDGRPIFDQDAINVVSADAGVDRVVVGGRDVTWFRASRPDDQPVQIPDYQLTDPFGYGPSSPLIIPRTAPMFETAGAGDLTWLREGAEVLYQRVYPDHTDIDYRGLVTGVRATNVGDIPLFALEVAGEVSGRASGIYRPPPALRRVKDVGHWAWLGLTEMTIPFLPKQGPVTGARIPDAGDMQLDAWLAQQTVMSQTRTGARYTLMPKTWGQGVYEFRLRDTTTKHLTLYGDGVRVSIEVYDDAFAQPTTWYASGVAPNGEHWTNKRLPGIIPGDPAPYPMEGGAPFGPGTTDAETVNGDGITVLWSKLVAIGAVDARQDLDFNGIYDQDIADGVEDLQHRAGLAATGEVNVATWNALFDIDATGYHNGGAKVHPIIQDPEVRKYNYTENGSIAGRNPLYKRSKLRVDRALQPAPGLTKTQMRNWARGEQARTSGKNWVGTITLTRIGAFTGEHGNADAGTLTADDLMPLRAIRPYMNAWAPYFDGGTLFHVAGVQVAPGGDSVTLTVDTQNRNYLEISAIVARNKEADRDPRREWWASNRSTKRSGNLPSRSELTGKLPSNRVLNGDRWNVFPIPAGTSGTVNRVWLKTFDRPTEFYMAVFANEVTVTQLQRMVGNPGPVAADGTTVWEKPSLKRFFNRRGLLYTSGNVKQPCGYGISDKYGPNGQRTSAPLTGEHLDDSPWGYVTDEKNLGVVWVAVYAERRSVLRRGQILWALEDDVV